jgi:hypothetical protein
VEKLAAEYDQRLLSAMIRETVKLDQVDEIEKRLDMAEAMNLAIVAAFSKKNSDGVRAYKRYRADLIRKRNKLLGMKGPTIWDKLPKGKSKRF